MKRLLIVTGLLVVGAACTVDETGYNNPDAGDGLGADDDVVTDSTGAPESDSDGLSDTAAPSAGDLGGLGVYYTSDRGIGDMPVPITVLGLAGALSGMPKTEIGIEGEGRVPLLVSDDGSFVAGLVASAGDEVSIASEGTLVVRFVLEALADADLDDASGSGGLLPGAGEDTGAPSVPPGGLEVEVGDGDLDIAAPYLVWNTVSRVTLSVAVGDADATLTVQQGDGVCVAALDNGRALGAICQTL